MSKRAHISRETELAAALLQQRELQTEDEIAEVVSDYEAGSITMSEAVTKLQARAIPHEHAKLMSDAQIISLYHRDHHPIRHEYGGPDEAWNLTWRLGPAHRVKSAAERTDAAKERAVRRARAKHDAAMAEAAILGRALDDWALENRARAKPKRKIPSRPFQRRKK